MAAVCATSTQKISFRFVFLPRCTAEATRRSFERKKEPASWLHFILFFVNEPADDPRQLNNKDNPTSYIRQSIFGCILCRRYKMLRLEAGYRTGHPPSHTPAILLSPVHRSKENSWLSQRRLLGGSVTIRVFQTSCEFYFLRSFEDRRTCRNCEEYNCDE